MEKDWLNPNLDIQSLKEEFNKNGIIVIENILKPEIAEKVYNFEEFTREL